MVCLYGVSTYKNITQESDHVYQRYSSQLVNALQLQVHLKKQIQAWKNVLLHDDEAELLAHYTNTFYREEAQTRALIDRLHEQLLPHTATAKMMQSFDENYADVVKKYHLAMSLIEKSPNVPLSIVDKQVLGIDKQPADLINSIVVALTHERDNALKEITEQRAQWESNVIYVVVGSIALVSVLFSLFLNRTVIFPLLELKSYAQRLCKGDYDTPVEINNNHETTAVAEVLNTLSNSLSEYTTYMEDSLKQLTHLATDLADANETVVEKESRLTAIVDNMADGVIILTHDGRIEIFNPAACNIFGYSEEEIINRTIDILFENKASFNLNQNDQLIQESRGIRRDGRTFLMDCAVNEFCVDGESYYVLSVRDVTLRKLTEQKLVQLANYDSLTHLPNRTMLQSRLKSALELSSHKNTMLAVLHINIDHFKRINDTFGYSVGDHLLKQIATRLKTCSPKSDFVSRLGSDEFALVLDYIGSDVNAPSKAAKQILEIMAHPFALSGHQIYANCSIGISLFPNDASDVEDLLRQANIAMHHAKSQGDGQFRYYSKDMDVCGLEKIQLEGRIRQAVAKQEFLFHYQPQIDIHTGRVVGAEALLRWNDPESGLIPPLQFIPLLEESGLINQLGSHLLLQACEQGRQWQDEGFRDLTVSINLSARQFEDPNLLSMVEQILSDTGFKANNLELEITESTIMGDADKSQRILQALSNMGIRVAIDDFGTGYSSLSYLRSFSLNTLKIDRSFVKEIDIRKDDRAISQSIINMAHNLNMDVVAEGVETQSQSDILKSLGCRVVQGFFYSKPIPVEEMSEFLIKNREESNPSEHIISNEEEIAL